MAMNVGTISLDAVLNTSPIQSQLNSIQGMARTVNFGNANSQIKQMAKNLKTINTNTNKFANSMKQAASSAKGMSGSVNKLGSSALAANKNFSVLNATIGAIKRNLLYFLSFYKLVQFAGESITLGSGLVEDEHVLDITLGKMADDMKTFCQELKATSGMAQAEATKFAGGFSKVFKSMNISDEQNSDMTKTLMSKMGDVASTFNWSYEKTYNKIMSSVIGGNSRAAREMGLSLLIQDMQEYMTSLGDNRAYNQLSSYKKLMYRYQKAMSDLNYTTGDFVKTQYTWTNQTRILSSTWNDFKTVIGQNLIMLLQPVLVMLNKLVSGFLSLAQAVNTFFKSLGWGSRLGQAGLGESVEEYTDDLEDAQEGIGNSASKAAKKIQRALFGFDKVNRLTSSSADSGSEASGVSSSPYDFSFDMNTGQIEEATSKFQPLIDKVKELKNLFVDGFKMAFQADTSKFLENVDRIKSSLSTLFKDTDIQNAANSYLNQFISTLGSMVGSITSIGVSIGTWITGGIANALEKNSGNIKQWFLDVFKEGEGILKQVQDYAVAIADIFTVFEGINAENLLGNVLSIIGNAFGTITGLFIRFKNDVVKFFTQPIIDNVDGIKQALDGLFGAWSDYFAGMNTVITSLGQNLIALYDENIRPYFDSITASVSEWIGIIVDGYNKYILPVVQKMGEKMKELGEKCIPIIEDLKDIFGNLFTSMKIAWDSVLSPLVSFLLKSLMPILGAIAEGLGWIAGILLDGLVAAIKFATGFIKDITEVLLTLHKTIGAVWDAFWNLAGGIADVFSSIPDIVKSAINGVVGIINSMINSVNKISIDIPNPFGGDDKHIGFNIPNIPQLANGGYIEAGHGGALVEIGEGRYDEVTKNTKQIENEEKTIINGVEDRIEKILERILGNGTNMNNSQIPIVIQFGDTEFANLVIDVLKREAKRTGKPILGGV